MEPELLLRGWEAQERADVQAQYQIRREIARAQARSGPPPGPAQQRARAVAYPVQPRGLSEDQARYVMAEAIAVTQARISAWTKADLIRYLGEALPAGVMADRATLENLAARAISGAAGERVELLSAPEWPRVPDGLRRADGESVFRPHGAERYASQAQLSLEERLLAQAQEPGAPHLDPAVAARLLGADAERLQAQLQPAPDTTAPAGITGERAADGSGRRRLVRADLAAAGRGDGRPGRDRQDPHRDRDGPRLAAGRDRAGGRADRLQQRPQRAARRSRPARRHRPGLLQHR